MQFSSRVRHPSALSDRFNARSARLVKYVSALSLATFMLLALLFAPRGSGPGMFSASLFGLALVGWWRQVVWGHVLAVLAYAFFCLGLWAGLAQGGTGITYPNLASLPSWAIWLVVLGTTFVAFPPLVVKSHLRRAWW
jgi:hypothetical protein